jgi:UDP-galactose transporter B1
LTFLFENPSLYVEILKLASLALVGQQCILYLVSNFGSLVCTVVTTTRKFFTILASVVLYSHPLSNLQWGGVVCVFAGLVWDMTAKGSKHGKAGDKDKKKK